MLSVSKLAEWARLTLPAKLLSSAVWLCSSRAEALLPCESRASPPSAFDFLGLESLHPFGRPILLCSTTREVSRCHVSPHQVRPLHMSRTVLSLTPYRLAISAAEFVGIVLLILNISITCSTESLALVLRTGFIIELGSKEWPTDQCSMFRTSDANKH
jgi:hypothetical protein